MNSVIIKHKHKFNSLKIRGSGPDPTSTIIIDTVDLQEKYLNNIWLRQNNIDTLIDLLIDIKLAKGW